MPVPTHKWLERYALTDPAHVDHLETSAALHEFHGGLPRHEAEEAAHKDYQKDQLEEAAAHHLNGIKASLGAGDRDSAHKHGVLYGLALKKLGHPIVGEPPASIASKAKHSKDSVYRFKAHKGDLFALPEEKHEG